MGATIEIVFVDRKLEATCSEESECKRRWGASYRILLRRLASLLAAETLADMGTVPGRCHALTGDRHGQYALRLWGSYRLVFEPADLPNRNRQGGIDLSQVTKVRVLEIVDYHGD